MVGSVHRTVGRHGFRAWRCDNAVVASRSERPERSALGAAAVLGAVVVVSALAGCGDDGGGDAAWFCGEVAANKDALTNPTLTYADDIEPLLDLYRTIGELVRWPSNVTGTSSCTA